MPAARHTLSLQAHTKHGKLAERRWAAVAMGSPCESLMPHITAFQFLARCGLVVLQETPLFFAAENGDAEIVDLLLEQPAVNVDKRSQSGATPVSTAAWKGSFFFFFSNFTSVLGLQL